MLAARGTHATDSKGGRSCWHIVKAVKFVTHDGVGFHPTGGGDIPTIPFL